ncbi:MAG: hypothetical protein ACPG5P_06790 [Saprospiraceae bacterium]
MMQILYEALQPANVVYTTLLGLSILYWVVVIMGALDIDGIDFDLDLDADVDADVDMDTDLDTGGNFLSGILVFFNFGKIPFMIVFSFASLWMWVLGILSNHYLGLGSLLMAVMLFIPILFIALLITKLVTTPLVPMFESMGGDVDNVEYMGVEGKIILPLKSGEIGQLEIIHNDDVHTLNVRLEDSNQNWNLRKGDKAYIVGRNKEKDFYIITPS